MKYELSLESNRPLYGKLCDDWPARGEKQMVFANKTCMPLKCLRRLLEHHDQTLRAVLSYT